MTDDEGNEINNIDYYPYGSTRSGDVPTDRKFTGQRLDDTGLYYYGARYYDPEIGRFISADTIVQYPANPQSFNRYSYCLNNPLKYIDPSGHYVYIEGYDVRGLDWLYQNPELAAQFAGSATGATQAAISEEYETHAEVRAYNPEFASSLEDSDIIYEIDIPTPDLPISRTSTSKTVNYYSETNRSYHIPIPTNTEVTIKYGPTNEDWNRLGEFLTGVILTTGGSILAAGTIITAMPFGFIGWGLGGMALYAEVGIILNGVNKIAGKEIVPNLPEIFGPLYFK